ncbi:ribonuclease J [Bacillus weihaiensis]|uniref:ribonuclease J n=1 Tax=Bacillus weihaiensis TaxID=1547283 RepID=UPI0023523588|nr:ribonuclease J [Bacillus weihaiensis]
MTTINEISVFALGGLHEIGKNMYAIEDANSIVVIDCGNKFPDESLLGIDLIIPDISYLEEKKEKVKALIVTHGHEDHIGGIPFFLKKVNVPVYATRFTLGLIELKLTEHKLLRETQLIEIDSKSELKFDEMTVEFFKVNHSIPDCIGVVFHTSQGVIVHSGDFKFDLTPMNNDHSDLHKMAKIGEEGVLLLLSESTNAERSGASPSEEMVGQNIEAAFKHATGKVFISTFASNIYRVQQVVDAAKLTNRKLVLLGRSMVNVVDVAMERGYLNVPENMLIDQHVIDELPPERICVLCTGSQGEPMAALARLSTGNFRGVTVLPEDTIILAAGPIPGNEKNVTQIIDQFYELGAKVIYGTGKGMHVSGHGYQEDLKLMLTLMKPKYFIPIHGEYRMLHHHRLLAESVGVEKGHTFLLKNGDVVDLENGIASQTRSIPVDSTYIDGIGFEDVGDLIMRDRKQLSEDGMLVVVITISKRERKLISPPDTISRGFVDQREANELIRKINQLVKKTISDLDTSDKYSWNTMKQKLRKTVGQQVFAETRKKPMILPIVIEV